MIKVITTLSAEQELEVNAKLYSLNNIAVCPYCRALIQFDEKDINRTNYTPTIGCACGNTVKIHSKYRSTI